MDIKHIQVFLQAGSSQGALIAAGVCAAKFEAFVDGVGLAVEPELSPADCFAVGASAIADVGRRHEAALRQAADVMEAEFRAAIRPDHGLDWRCSRPSELPEECAARARTADLTVIGRAGHADAFHRQRIEALVLRSGTPCLIVPQALSGDARLERPVLAWNGSRESKRAMSDGMDFVRRAGRVDILVVHSGASDDEAPGLRPLMDHLARHGVEGRLHRKVGSPGESGQILLASAESLGGDLLIMGAYGRSQAVECILGGATRSALSHAHLPILMSH